ncbi:MAG: alpha/beta fold hydrolase [Acidobacteria bacterium]|nr:alpha/beta fold hydrolase [Acidobacteriota bacterium]
MKLEIINRKPDIQRFDAPLLFVHGTGHSAWCWDENFLPYFATNGFDSYALSLRGHGTSEGAENLKWTSIADYVNDVAQVASAFESPPVIVGHSMGGLVVQKYLELHSAPAAVLVAPSPSEGMFRSAMFLPLKHPLLFWKIGLKQDYSIMFSTVERAKRFLFSDDADEERIAGYVGRFGKESYRANLEMIYNLPDTRKITAPMLVVGAENDALVAVRAVEKTARAYNADCKIFTEMAHDMMLEQRWREVADFVIEWLGKTIR